jgi:hypothetical protein
MYLFNLSFKAFSSSRNASSISGEVRCPSATLLTKDALTFNLRAILAYTPLKSEIMFAAVSCAIFPGMLALSGGAIQITFEQ